MLPAHRVIGHREYGNQPNGWPGRKSDPTYSMAWRRDRVAAFKPRTGSVGSVPTPKPAPTPSEDEVTDADIQKIVAALRAADFSPAPGTQSLQNLISQLHTVLVANKYQSKVAPDNDPVTLPTYVLWGEGHAQESSRKLDEVLELLRQLVQPPPAA